MKHKLLIATLATIGASLPGLGHTAEAIAPVTPQDVIKPWADMFVYAVTPYCRVLSNGMRVCQPIGFVGPAPSKDKPGIPSLTPVPLAAPSTQSPAAPASAYAGSPFPSNSFAASPGAGYMPGSPAFPQGFLPPGLPPQYMSPYASQPYMPQPFMLPQPVPYQTFLAQFAPAQAVPVAAPPAAPAPIAAAPAQPATTTQQAVPSPTTTTPAPTAVAANTAPSSPAVPAPAAPAAVSTVVPLTATPLPEVTSPSATQAAPAAAQAIPGTVVHFEFDSAELNNSGRLVLNGWLMDVPKDLPLRLTGHSDRLGPETYNLSLSQRRAMTVQQYLVEKGMKSEAMQIMAKGEKAPVIKCKGGATPATKTCLAPNRRVEVDPR